MTINGLRGFQVLRAPDGAAAGGATAAAAGGAGDPAAAGAAAAAGASPGAGAAAAAAAVWTDSIQDPARRDWAVNKGYNKFDAATAAPTIADQYYNLEKLFGADKAGRTVELPDFEKGDEASLNAFYDRLGRPKAATDYNLELPVDGAIDKDFSDGMAGLLHKAGVPSRQATVIAKGYQEFSAARDAANKAAETARYADEDKGLKTEWGAKYDDNMALAAAAAKSLAGVDGDGLVALQKVAGYGKVMKMFASVAAQIGEDKFIGGERSDAGGKMTPAEAKVALNQLLGDKDVRAALMDKHHPKHAEYMARKAQLAAWEVGQ